MLSSNLQEHLLPSEEHSLTKSTSALLVPSESSVSHTSSGSAGRHSQPNSPPEQPKYLNASDSANANLLTPQRSIPSNLIISHEHFYAANGRAASPIPTLTHQQNSSNSLTVPGSPLRTNNSILKDKSPHGSPIVTSRHFLSHSPIANEDGIIPVDDELAADKQIVHEREQHQPPLTGNNNIGDSVSSILLNPSSSPSQPAKSWSIPLIGKIFVFLASLDAILLITISFCSLFLDDSVGTDVKYTCIVAIICTAAFYYFAVDAILMENFFQYWACLTLHSLMTLYVIYHYTVLSQSLGSLYQSLSLYVMIIICVFHVIFLILAYFIKRSFGWRFYKIVGGNILMRRLYRQAEMFFTLLKLDFCFSVLLLLLACFFLFTDTTELALNVVGVAATIGWVVVGYLAVRRERRDLMICFFILALIEPIYVVLKLYAMATDTTTSYPESTFQQFYITAALALCCRGYLLVYAIRCVINFSRGLRERVFEKIARRQADERRAAERRRRRAREKKVTIRTESAESHSAPRIIVKEGEAALWKPADMDVPEKKELNGRANAVSNTIASDSSNGIMSSPSSGSGLNGASPGLGALSGITLEKKKKIVKKKNPGSVPSQQTLIAYEENESEDEFANNANEWDGRQHEESEERKRRDYAEDIDDGNVSANENSLNSIDSFARAHIQSLGSGEDI